jgi:hypothetical protein
VPRENSCNWGEEMCIEFCPLRANANSSPSPVPSSPGPDSAPADGSASGGELQERYHLRFQVFDQLPRDHPAAHGKRSGLRNHNGSSDSLAGSSEASSEFDLGRVRLVGCADVPIDVPGGDGPAAVDTKQLAVGLRLGEAGRPKGVLSAALSCAAS